MKCGGKRTKTRPFRMPSQPGVIENQPANPSCPPAARVNQLRVTFVRVALQRLEGSWKSEGFS